MRKVTSKSVIARDFVIKSKCMFGGRVSPTLLRELKRFPQTSFSDHKIINNVWRPGSTRTCWGA